MTRSEEADALPHPADERSTSRQVNAWSIGFVVCFVFAVHLWAQHRRGLFPFDGLNQVEASFVFGGSHIEIAKSILARDGYSNPFVDPTGPTAWMPPVMTWLLAGVLYVVDGNEPNALQVLAWFQFASCLFFAVATTVLAMRVANLIVAVVLVCVYLFCFRDELLEQTNDPMITVPAATLALLTLIPIGRLLRNEMDGVAHVDWWHSFWRGLCGGFVWLCTPAVGIAWTVATAWMRRASPRGLAITACAAGLVLMPWLIRCQLSLGGTVPVKSNAGFELWQSQVVDDDGLLDAVTMSRHPNRIGGAGHRERMRELGEVAFCREKMREAVASIASDPANYVARAGNRLFAAFVFPMGDDPFANNSASARIPIGILRVLTLVSVLVVFLSLQHSISPIFKAALLIWGLTLLPYGLTSFTERYAVATIPAQVLICTEGLAAGWAMWRQPREPVSH